VGFTAESCFNFGLGRVRSLTVEVGLIHKWRHAIWGKIDSPPLCHISSQILDPFQNDVTCLRTPPLQSSDYCLHN